VLHELLIFCIIKQLIPVLTCFLLLQIPLIHLLNGFFKKNPELGNHFYWFGMISGVPLMTSLYMHFMGIL
jgi:hypothetical protein